MGLVRLRLQRFLAANRTLIRIQGKTLQMLALIMHNKVEKPTLVITPLSVLYVWKREIDSRLTIPPDKVCVYHGDNRNLHESQLRNFRLILTNYETIM